jgi:hypothetical protein
MIAGGSANLLRAPLGAINRRVGSLRHLRDYLTARTFSQRAGAFPPERKAALARDLREAQERLAAARLLWSSGLAASGFRLVVEAWNTACAAARTVAALPADRSLIEVLEALSVDDASRLAESDQSLAALVLPHVADDVVAAHVAFFPRIANGSRELLRTLEASAATDRDVARLRRRRVASSLSIAVLGALFILVVVLAQFRARATCSAKYSVSHEAANVLDAHPDSEWLLPDNAPGWIDLTLSPARTVSTVRIINAHNSIHNDRATKQFRIEVYRKGDLVKTVDGTFSTLTPTPDWTKFELGRQENVSRIRVVVNSWHGLGGGFGEIRVD